MAELPAEMHELLSAWAFNVMLECSHPDNDPPRIAIGGDVLNLRDLERLLDWMVVEHLTELKDDHHG